MIEALENSLLITGTMLIGNANTLLEDGRKLMTSGKLSGEVIFDLAGVKETDSSALSVLLSLMRLKLISSPQVGGHSFGKY